MTLKPQKINVISYILPRLQDVLFISIFLAVIGIGSQMLNIDGDLGRHITIGENILDTGNIPTKDIFSHTMNGDPLTPHEWASQLIFGLMHRQAGLNGIVWFCAILISVTFFLVYKQAIRRGGLILISLGVATLAAASASLHWLARPHLFTMLFAIIWVNQLERLKKGRAFGWLYFPFIMLLWVNLHGAFIVGFVIWGIYFVGESINVLLKWENADINQPEMKDALVKLVPPYLLTGVLSFLVTFLNPSGFQIWETSLGFLGNQYLVSHTAEYFPPNFHDPSTWPFLMMILFSLAILGLRRQRISWISLWMLVGWTAMGLYSVRNVPLYAVMIAPILAEFSSVEINFNHGLVGFKNLQMRLLKVETNLRGHVWPILVIFIFGVAAISGYRLDINEGENLFYEDVFPVNAVDWLAENPQSGKVFNYFPWGGYLLYRLWPSELVFIDGQTDFYGEALTREYEQVITLTGKWESVLDKYHVTWIFMPSESLLVRELKDDQIWEEVYSDSTSSILVRSP